jgi:hypothetical protein
LRERIEPAIEAAVVNCTLAFVASQPKWRRPFQQTHLPIIPDSPPAQFKTCAAAKEQIFLHCVIKAKIT